MTNSNCLIYHILYPNIEVYVEYIHEKHETVNLQKTYLNKIENRITFKIRTGYYLGFFIAGIISQY